MTAQLALPGLDAAPTPLALARADERELYAAWRAVCHIQDSEERSRLQVAWERAYKLADRLENGPAWWH